MVDRYDGIDKDPEGAFVYYQDYQALEAERDRLKEEIIRADLMRKPVATELFKTAKELAQLHTRYAALVEAIGKCSGMLKPGINEEIAAMEELKAALAEVMG